MESMINDQWNGICIKYLNIAKPKSLKYRWNPMSKGEINIKNSASRSDLQAFRKMDKILEKLMVNANDSRTKYQIIFPIQKTCIDLY